jgi:hypothetical protein
MGEVSRQMSEMSSPASLRTHPNRPVTTSKLQLKWRWHSKSRALEAMRVLLARLTHLSPQTHKTAHAIATMNTTLAPRFAQTRTTATCSLCHESPAADVATHLDGEDEGIAEPTFAMIKVLFPDWREDHGACTACWSFCRNLVLVLNSSGCFDTRFRISGRRGNASVNPNGDDQGSLQFQRSRT